MDDTEGEIQKVYLQSEIEKHRLDLLNPIGLLPIDDRVPPSICRGDLHPSIDPGVVDLDHPQRVAETRRPCRQERHGSGCPSSRRMRARGEEASASCPPNQGTSSSTDRGPQDRLVGLPASHGVATSNPSQNTTNTHSRQLALALGHWRLSDRLLDNYRCRPDDRYWSVVVVDVGAVNVLVIRGSHPKRSCGVSALSLGLPVPTDQSAVTIEPSWDIPLDHPVRVARGHKVVVVMSKRRRCRSKRQSCRQHKSAFCHRESAFASIFSCALCQGEWSYDTTTSASAIIRRMVESVRPVCSLIDR